jgi:predicted ABC-type ATPase
LSQEQFGGWNNKEAVLKAANHAEEMHDNCIKNQQNFIFKEERIKIRTLKGGHTVPAEKIKQLLYCSNRQIALVQ